MNRTIISRHKPVEAEDGAGVKLKRFFPVAGLDDVDPFVLLDHFGSDNPDDFIAGFPLHPHRGIETVTYMLEGRVRHRDSTGRSGTIEAGDVQWMSAGRGIMHEEMPEVADGRLDGFQLWVNLPARDKMKAAEYQEYRADQITEFEHQGHRVRLVTGTLLGHRGSVVNVSTQPLYADIRLSPGSLECELPEHHNAFVYLFEGALEVVGDDNQAEKLEAPVLAVLGTGDRLGFRSDSGARVLLAAGKPNNEPIMRSGPFVMNTREEIIQTWQEIRDGTFPPE